MPTTSKPCAAKWRTVSEPIRPPEPVTMAMGVHSVRSRRSVVVVDPGEDVGEDVARRALRSPVGVLEERRAVREVDRHVARARLRHRAEVELPCPLISRHSAVVSRSDRLPARPPPTLYVAPCPVAPGRSSWRSTSVDEVVDVQQVAHLLAGRRRSRCRRAARPKRCDSAQWVNTPWSTLPICHGPGDHAAAVHRPTGIVVLGQQAARPPASSRRTACARPSSGKSSAIPRAEAPGSGWSSASSKRVSRSLEREGGRGRPRDRRGWWRGRRPARRGGAAELEAVVGAEQVGVDDEVAAAVDARHHGRLGRALDERVERPGARPGRPARARRRARSRRRPSRRRSRLSSDPRRRSESSGDHLVAAPPGRARGWSRRSRRRR